MTGSKTSTGLLPRPLVRRTIPASPSGQSCRRGTSGSQAGSSCRRCGRRDIACVRHSLVQVQWTTVHGTFHLWSDVPLAVLASPSAVWAHDSLVNGCCGGHRLHLLRPPRLQHCVQDARLPAHAFVHLYDDLRLGCHRHRYYCLRFRWPKRCCRPGTEPS